MKISHSSGPDLLYADFPEAARKLIDAARENGNSVTFVDTFETARELFEPRRGKFNDVYFADFDGKKRPEFRVLVTENGVSITTQDEGNAARPASDAFFMGVEGEYSKRFISDVFPELRPEELLNGANEWLARGDLAVIPARVCGHDVLSIVPAPTAWAYLAWDLIHGVPTLADCLKEGFHPKALMLNAPGVRHSLLGGRHCTTFFPDQDLMTIVASSSYMGTAFSKKPMFMFMSWMLSQEGGILNHATASVTSFGSESSICLYSARSGCGKTEQRLPVPIDSAGVFRFGVSEEFGEVRLLYPLERHCRVVSGGDDSAVTGKLEKTPDGLGRVKNGEARGLFDRTTADDLELNEKIFEHSRPQTMLALSYAQEIGKRLCVHHRDETGYRNPRQTYPWSLLGELGVEYTVEELRYEHRVYGMGLLQEWAALSWANYMPPALGYLHRFVGFCKAKSRSVTGPTESSMIADWAGTVGCFSPLSMLEQANTFWRETEVFSKVRNWVVPIGFVGKFALPTEFDAEQFFRDFLVHMKCGHASWELVPAESPLFGFRPANVRFFGQEIPELFCSPAMQWGAKDYFEIAGRFQNEYQRILRPLAAEPQLAEGARRAIELFTELKPGGYSTGELQAIQDRFEEIV